MSNLGRISGDHQARLLTRDGNQLQGVTNKKLDTALVQQTAVNTKLDNLSGAINNNIGDGTVKLQTYVYAHDVSNGLSRPLKCDAAGRLECSVDALEITADTINLSTDQLEAKVDAVTSKLDSFAGAGNNNVGEGSSKLQTYLYARDVSAGNFKPLVCDGDAHLQIDCLSSALPSGAATEAKQDSGITHLATIAGDTTSLDSKVTLCNTGSVIIAASALPSGAATESTLASLLSSSQIISEDFTACDTGAVVVSSSALPSGAATAALQGTANTALSEIEGAVENLELTVGTNTATAPTRALQVGGKYVDGTFRDIKVDNIGKVIIDTPTGSDLDGRLATIGTNTAGLAGCVTGTELQVDVVTMPTVAVTLSGGATEAKQDVQETTLNAIQSAVEGTLTTTSAATLQTGSATIGKLAANSGIDIGDVDVTSISAGTNRIGKVILMGNEAVDGSGTERHALLDSAGHLQIDVLSAPSTAVTNAGLTSLAAAVNSDRVDVNIANGGFGGAVTNAGLTALDAAIGTDGSTGPAKCMSMAGTESGGNIQELLVDSSGHLQIDVLSAPSTAVTNAGLTSLAAAVNSDRVDVNIANGGFGGAVTNDGLTALDAAIGTDGSTGPAKCMSMAGTESGGNIQELLVDSSGHLQIDVLSAPSTAVTNAGLTALNGTIGLNKVNINLSSDAVGLSTSALQGTLNSKIDTIDGVLDNSLLKQTLATTSEVKEFLSGATVNSGAQSAEFDTENYERVRFFGESTASVGTDVILMGSNVSGGTFYVLGENLRSETISGVHYVYGPAMENLPRFIKILNKSGSTNYVFTKLYFQGSGGRLAV